MITCQHCGRAIERDAEGRWVDPEATGDDVMWREVCDENHEDRIAAHEPVLDPVDWRYADGCEYHDAAGAIYRHHGGKKCRHTRAGRFVKLGQGLGPEAECGSTHDDIDKVVWNDRAW